MHERMPSQVEQDIAEWYVLQRPLSRPDTSYKKAALCIALFVAVNILLAVTLFFLFERFGVFSYMPDPLISFKAHHQILFPLLFGLLIFCIGGIIMCKRAIIGAIRLYQRYAPEDIRRRCLFKPTCSEYAILAVQKYGVIRGLFKAYIRLFKKCRGNIYMIDEP